VSVFTSCTACPRHILSQGWNPYFKNEKKTIEAYLLHEFERYFLLCVVALFDGTPSSCGSDFYDAPMRLILARFLRPETSFPSMEALIAAITADVENARTQLDEEDLKLLGQEPFLFEKEGPKL
jgi:riboflavin kinase